MTLNNYVYLLYAIRKNIVLFFIGITLQGVRNLVKGLSALEFISFGSMGKILNSGEFDNLSTSLKLVHFNELDPEFVDVQKLQRLCPNIAHINLSVPISINPSGLIDANASVPCVEILKVNQSGIPYLFK